MSSSSWPQCVIALVLGMRGFLSGAAPGNYSPDTGDGIHRCRSDSRIEGAAISALTLPPPHTRVNNLARAVCCVSRLRNWWPGVSALTLHFQHFILIFCLSVTPACLYLPE